MILKEYLSVPYSLCAETMLKEDGIWIRKVEYPELPECFVENNNILEAMDQLEALKYEILLIQISRNKKFKVPRSPLKSYDPVPDLLKYGYREWLKYLETEIKDISNGN